MIQNKTNRKYSEENEKKFLLIFGLIFLILTFFVIKDIFLVIVFSFILSYFLFPIYSFFYKKIKNESLAAISTVISSVFIIFIPFAAISYFLILSLIKLVVQYKIYLENPAILNKTLETFISHFTNSNILNGINFSTYFNSAVKLITDTAENFFSSIPHSLFNFFILLFITYYILVHNEKLFRAINDYIPLSYNKQEKIFKSLGKNLKVLFKGYFLTGLAQSAVALFGYIIFGVPNLLIVTAITLFTSLIPYLGTPLVWVPISMYMIISGQETSGIGLLIYGTLVISTVDNFFRPYLMSDKDTISSALVFVGFIGGMFTFGISGIIIGPIIIAITSILLMFLKESYELKK